MMKPKIIFTVGPPRSGKSTFCEWLVRNPAAIEFDGRSLVIVDEDHIRLALNGKGNVFNPANEEMSRATKHLMIKALIKAGYAVVVSDTHTRYESCRPLLEIDPNALAVHLEYDRNDCLARAEKLGRSDLIAPILRTTNNLMGRLVTPNWVVASYDTLGQTFKIIDVAKELERKMECLEPFPLFPVN